MGIKQRQSPSGPALEGTADGQLIFWDDTEQDWDVSSGTPTNGQVPVWNSVTGEWEFSAAPTGAGTLDGQLIFWDDLQIEWDITPTSPSNGESPIWDAGGNVWTFGSNAGAFTLISQKSDLPAPSGNIITLTGGSYMFTGNVDLGTDRLRPAAGDRVLLQGQSESAVLTSASTSATIDGTAYDLTIINLQVNNTSTGSVLEPGASTFVKCYGCTFDGGASAFSCVTTQGTSSIFHATDCVFDGSVDAIRLTGRRAVINNCRVASGMTGAIIVAGSLDQLIIHGLVLEGTAYTGSAINFGSQDVDIVEVVGLHATGANAINFVNLGSGTKLSATFTGCSCQGWTNGFLSSTLPSDLFSIQGCYIDASTPFSGFTAASANTIIRGCSDSSGVLTETAIVP